MTSWEYEQQLKRAYARPGCNTRGKDPCPNCSNGVISYEVRDRGGKIRVTFSCDVCALESQMDDVNDNIYLVSRLDASGGIVCYASSLKAAEQLYRGLADEHETAVLDVKWLAKAAFFPLEPTIILSAYEEIV